MSFYTKNVECLKKLLPAFEEKILQKYKKAEDIEIITTPVELITAQVNGVLLHSKYNPQKEAERVIRNRIPEAMQSYVFGGFGFGYYIEEFIKIFPETIIFLFEPDIPLFLKTMEFRDFTPIFTNSRFKMELGSSVTHYWELLTSFGIKKTDYFILNYTAQKYHDWSSKLKKAINSFNNKEEINKNTLKRFGKLWVRNLVRNSSLLAVTPGVSFLKKYFTGIPSIVTAGGPSLDAVLPHLKKLSQKCIITAVDTTLPACLSAGVDPDFCIIVDPQYLNTRHLDRCDKSEAVIISESSTHPSIFHKLPGQLFFCSSLFPLGQFLEKSIGIKGQLGAGGSVATTAWDFCRYIGSNPVILAGLDLGFPDYATHFKGSFFETAAHITADRLIPGETPNFRYLYNASPFLMTNYNGKEILTDSRLSMYQKWFENQVAFESSVETKTATCEGVRIPGIGPISLEEIESFPDVRDQINLKMEECRKMKLPDNSSINHNKLQEAFLTIKKDLIELSKLSSKGIKIINKNMTNSDFQALDAVDSSILSISSRDIAGFLLYDLSTMIISNSGLKQEDALETSRRLYEKINAACQYHLEIISSLYFELNT